MRIHTGVRLLITILANAPLLAGRLQCGLIGITQLAGHLRGFAAALEQSERLQQLPLLLQFTPFHRRIGLLCPQLQRLRLAIGQRLPAGLQLTVALLADGALLQLIRITCSR